MYRAAVVLQLALWISGIHASALLAPGSLLGDEGATEKRHVAARDSMEDLGFVTFKMAKTPSRRNDNEPLLDKVSRIAHGLAQKYGSTMPIPTTRGAATLADRANTYNVVSPVPPTQSNSAGIYQDGTDFSYFIQAQFGSGATPMYMLVDTGASTSWVMGSGCTTDACKKHNTFGADNSKTLKDTGAPFSVGYGSGDVSGHVVSDTVKMAGFSVPYTFGLANQTSDQFGAFPFDGILGLARGTGNFNDALKAAKLINANVFGVSLARNADGPNNGEISFGAPNPAKYTGEFTYASVTDAVSWAIPVDGVNIGGKSAGVKSKPAFIDTGTTFAFGPPSDVAAMYKMIPDAQSNDNGATWTFPCDTTVSVSFTFSGKAFPVDAKDFVGQRNGNRCTGNIYGIEVVNGAWLLGDVFLKNVYAVFDIDKGRIGFASRASGTGTAATTSQPTTIVSTMTTSNGQTTLTTITTATTPTSAVGIGFTGGHNTASVGSTPTDSAAQTAGTTTGSSSGGRSEVHGKYISIACIISILAMVA